MKRGGGGAYSVLPNCQSLFSNFLPIAALFISLSVKYRRNRLLFESFIELLRTVNEYGINATSAIFLKDLQRNPVHYFIKAKMCKIGWL